MSATKITDLLPIPPGTRQPHPYQVLGLEDGEQDPSVINAASQIVVSRLKAAKSQSDPAIWKQAARMVLRAQEVLSDPEQKASLDARFGIVSMDPVAGSSPSSSDSLAAFLPSADPLSPSTLPQPPTSQPPTSQPPTSRPPTAAALPKSDSLPTDDIPIVNPRPDQAPPSPVPSESTSIESKHVPVNAMPPGLFGTPSTDADSSPLIPSVQAVVKPARVPRKGSKAGTALFLVFAFGTFGAIVTLVYFMVFGSGQIAITKSDGGISISTQPPQNAGTTVVGEPRQVAPPRVRTQQDPIMGSLAPSDSSPSPLEQPSGLTRSLPIGLDSDSLNADLQDGIAISMDSDIASITTPDEAFEMLQGTTMAIDSEKESEASLDMQHGGAQPAEAAMTADPTGSTMTPVSNDTITEADETLERVRTLIRKGTWKAMKPAAQEALEQRMSGAQMREAQALFELADLATYYRSGIEKAVAELNVGSDFEITDDFRVIVVEVGPDLLIVRFNAKNRSYRFDELPWSLAHKLATFTMPDDPTAQAAKAAYQAIAPNSNQAYRDQALKWLEEIQGDVQGADPQRLTETIRSLFAES